MATSGSGIFGRAKNAANTYRNSVSKENTALQSYQTEYDNAYNAYVVDANKQ